MNGANPRYTACPPVNKAGAKTFPMAQLHFNDLVRAATATYGRGLGARGVGQVREERRGTGEWKRAGGGREGTPTHDLRLATDFGLSTRSLIL